MNTLRIVIADDERPSREFLKALLRDMPDVALVGEAENGSDAVELIKAERPDLALLDLQMPELSGMEVVKALPRTHVPLVAFVTAFDEYAVKAFELNAIDYLLKPVEKNRLRDTVLRAAERLEHADWREAETIRLSAAAGTYEAAVGTDLLERIPVKDRDEILLIPVGQVASIVADGELLKISTSDKRRFTINYRLKDIEPRLDERMFVRLSRSALVNVEMINKVSPMPGGTYTIVLNNGQELQSSRLQSKILRAKLLKL
ncbi:MAG: LytTR family DNA-binding domain-containing protein [Pyrinomonadaceae bacterium]|nr:LytTR family DNA-binding domain-containing protein [Pyrinomonadaceae bacterium]